MRYHYAALENVLQLAGFTTYLVEAPGNVDLPYLLIEPQSADGIEQAVCGTNVHLEISFRLKAVAALPGVAMDQLTRAQKILSPTGQPEPLDGVPDRVVDVQWRRHETDTFDQQVTVPGSTRHLALSIDTYRMVSTPKSRPAPSPTLTDVDPGAVTIAGPPTLASLSPDVVPL